MDDLDGPYRSPGATRLGPVVHRFAIRRRRRVYGGAASSVARSPILMAGLVPPSPLRSGRLGVRSVVVRDAIEVCVGGLRVREPFGVLELGWEELVAVEREEVAGELHQLRVTAIHGQEITLDRTVHELASLATLLDQGLARDRAARSP